ncbi:uncharacterized protein L969DRAFT_234557 [Mixia osmundae IAM 14324]|uniref:BAG domain-containing protein n=1 Tax=Mixia osmundae (strain CBS 9802 / IAM 14324 / JCM 22182 / KY 12970) TaxID=764103 RepID=G7E2F7_MIXOS|nr:uncharacterized protein L969DRAFT_234557 [Mixia osmundae IAM 14324]KEI36886.1 hypothetical protein L969DRAFT_234557 [Mixia osmundae IAM 14324]GAA97017.1 hypothetical protein E5Q_03691 [Mixia osmundae IAM 14324]
MSSYLGDLNPSTALASLARNVQDLLPAAQQQWSRSTVGAYLDNLAGLEGDRQSLYYWLGGSVALALPTLLALSGRTSQASKQTLSKSAKKRKAKRKQATTSGNSTDEQTAGKMDVQTPPSVILHWGRERYTIELPPAHAPLSVLRSLIQQKTSVAPEHQKLIISGFVAKDDAATMAQLGLVDGPSSKAQVEEPNFSSLMKGWGAAIGLYNDGKKKKEKRITLIAAAEASGRVSDRPEGVAGQGSVATSGRKSAARDEPTLVQSIKAISDDATQRLETQIVELEGSASGHPVAISADRLASPAHEDSRPGTPSQTVPLHVRLSEALLQILLKLDSVDVPPEWQEARLARKNAVREVQSKLDRVDRAKEMLAKHSSTG